jgi:hypothetical protein
MIENEEEFDKMWEKFLKVVGEYFKFKIPFP